MIRYYLVTEFKDGAKRLDDVITAATSAYTLAKARQQVRQLAAARPAALEGRKLPPPPDWWGGDEEASRSALLAAQQLGKGGAS